MFRQAMTSEPLIVRVAAIAQDRDCGRLEWSVLDWNEPAVNFYKKLGAVPMHEWTVFRLTGENLTRFAVSETRRHQSRD